jgi:hypothetical protein
MLAAAVQDDMLTAAHDLWRLRSLLNNGIHLLTEQLINAFDQVTQLPGVDAHTAQRVRDTLGRAVVGMQMHDMAEQLIDHIQLRLNRSTDLVAEAMFGEGDVAHPEPMKSCPVAHDDRQGGSVELF